MNQGRNESITAKAIVAARRPDELLYRRRYVRQPPACLCVAYRLHRSQNA